MKVHVYAVLKDYFEKEFELHQGVGTVKELNDVLLQRNPVAANVLDTCRFAVNDTFVDHHFQLHNNDIICIIPPSSGG